jgi:polyisoprenoid-binding protein YceI
MIVSYRLDPGQSRFTVQAFAGGVLSFVAHSPTFIARDYAGELRLSHDDLTGELRVTVRAESLELVDQVSPSDRQEIEGRMRREVLETAAYPDIRLEADDLSGHEAEGNQYHLRIRGQLSVHGATGPVEVDARLLAFRDGARVSGECPLRLSEYGIRPVTALAGAIKLKDQLRVAFDLAFLREEQEGP